MSFLHTFFKQRSIIPVTVAVVMSVLFVVGMVQAATTISTNITTEGTLTVTGPVYASSTGQFDGDLFVNGYATTTASNGNFAANGSFTVGGPVYASSTGQFDGNLFVNGFSTTTASNGNFSTSGTFSVGTSTFSHDFVVEGIATSTFTGDTATTSIFVNSNTALFGGQIILENPDGVTCSRIAIDDAGTGVDVIVVTCPSSDDI